MTDAPHVAKPHPAPRTHRMKDALADAWRVNWRCGALLSAVVPVAMFAIAALRGGELDPWGLGGTSLVVVLVHLAVVAVVGYPLGVVLSWKLPVETSRARASIWFAGVGGAAGGLLMCWFGPMWLMVWAALGAAVAGSARAWAHASISAAAASRDAIRSGRALRRAS